MRCNFVGCEAGEIHRQIIGPRGKFIFHMQGATGASVSVKTAADATIAVCVEADSPHAASKAIARMNDLLDFVRDSIDVRRWMTRGSRARLAPFVVRAKWWMVVEASAPQRVAKNTRAWISPFE